MSKRDAREKLKGRKAEGGFFRLTHFVLRSVEFQQLSPRAVKAFLALAAEYNGQNNGVLALPRSQMLARGFGRNGNQAAGAIKELIGAGFVICTRPGKLKVGPSYYAITTEPVDASDKHPFAGQHVAAHLWRRKNVGTETVHSPAPKPCIWEPETAHPSTETVPVAATSEQVPSTKTVHLYRLPSEAALAGAGASAAGAPAGAPDLSSKSLGCERPKRKATNGHALALVR